MTCLAKRLIENVRLTIEECTVRAIIAWDAILNSHLLPQPGYLQSTCRETQQDGAGNQLIELTSNGK
jgi:hypothetical protein